jgi:hypothetical protein
MEIILNWFESLKNTKQIDEYLEASFKNILAIFSQIIQWFSALSVNQKLIVSVVTIGILYCLNFGILKFRKFIHKLMVDYRRRKIPDNINLNLDRDAAIRNPNDLEKHNK